MDSCRPQAHWPLGSLANGRLWRKMRPRGGEDAGVFLPAPLHFGALTLHSWVPLMVLALRGAWFSSLTLQASSVNSHPLGLSWGASASVRAPFTLSQRSASGPFTKPGHGAIRENSFSYLPLGNTLLDYCFTGVFLNKLTF